MICPKCKSPMLEDSLFCSTCGTPIGEKAPISVKTEEPREEIDRTMAIPVIRTKPEPAPSPSPRRADFSGESSNPKSKKGNTKVKVLSFVVAFLSTIVILLAITLAVLLLTTSSEDKPKPIEEEIVTASETEEKEPVKDEKEEPKEGESTGVDTGAVIKIDTEFKFSTGKTLESSALKYTTIKNTKYGYKCDVPESFVSSTADDGETRYKAKDDTAYMDIGAFENSDDLNCDDIKEMIADTLSKTTDYEEEGENWFASRRVKDSVVYYHKCYVEDKYVKYMEFVYPEEYSEVYDVFVSDVEQTFVSTK